VVNEHKDKQTLIVVDYLDHGQRLYDLLEPLIGSDNVDFIHGLADTREGSLADFRKGTLRVLISSSIIDEGIDISRIQLLVLAGGKKSKRQILQRIGRGLRRKAGENVVVILDIFDRDKKYLERHSKERLKLYNKEGFHVEIVES
jgi:superfamily II DNA or RNA helicase